MNIVMILGFILLLFGENISTRGNHSAHEREKFHKKIYHKKNLNAHSVLYKTDHRELKGIKARNTPQRCRIICPIVLPLPGDCGGGNPTAIRSTDNQSEPIGLPIPSLSVKPSTQTYASQRDSKHNNKQVLYEEAPSKTVEKNIGKKVKPFDFLATTQQRILMKKLKLANQHGRKVYKFRRIVPFLCAIECDEAIDDPTTTTSPQTSMSASDSEDDSDYDSYQEGEDTPIEATIKPFVPANLAVEGIKPFGLADFMGWHDFRPNGDIAREP